MSKCIFAFVWKGEKEHVTTRPLEKRNSQEVRKRCRRDGQKFFANCPCRPKGKGKELDPAKEAEGSKTGGKEKRPSLRTEDTKGPKTSIILKRMQRSRHKEKESFPQRTDRGGARQTFARPGEKSQKEEKKGKKGSPKKGVRCRRKKTGIIPETTTKKTNEVRADPVQKKGKENAAQGKEDFRPSICEGFGLTKGEKKEKYAPLRGGKGRAPDQEEKILLWTSQGSLFSPKGPVGPNPSRPTRSYGVQEKRISMSLGKGKRGEAYAKQQKKGKEREKGGNQYQETHSHSGGNGPCKVSSYNSVPRRKGPAKGLLRGKGLHKGESFFTMVGPTSKQPAALSEGKKKTPDGKLERGEGLGAKEKGGNALEKSGRSTASSDRKKRKTFAPTPKKGKTQYLPKSLPCVPRAPARKGACQDDISLSKGERYQKKRWDSARRKGSRPSGLVY